MKYQFNHNLQILVFSRLIQDEISLFSSMINSKIDNDYESFEVRLKRIIRDITGINTDLFKSRARKREIVQARQLFHSFMLLKTNLTLKAIGELTGHDHATVLHSKKTIEDLRFNNKEIQFYYNEIENKLDI